MGAVWSALLVGGGLAGALFAWLLRDQGKGRSEMEKDAPHAKAKAPGGCDQGGSPPLSPGPLKRELDTKPGILLRRHMRGWGGWQVWGATRVLS